MGLHSRSGEVDGEGFALVEGAFYWVIPAYCPDFISLLEEWNNERQPARYDGNDLWNALGEGSDDCPEEWPIIQIGKRIYPPE